MKKISFVLIMLVTIFYSFNVNAKDTVVSMNKYKEEKFNQILNTYDLNGSIDGLLTGGYILKEEIELEDNKYNDYQAIVVKYDKKNKIVWDYTYGKTKEDYLDYLNYSYNSEGKIDGYLLSVIATSDVNENSNNETVFIKIDLEGKEILQKPLSLNQGIRINKIITTYNEGLVEGYIAIGNNGTNSYLIKLDKDLNVVWSREVSKENNLTINYADLVPVMSENKLVGYSIIKEVTDPNNQKTSQLIKYNNLGEEPAIIADLNKYDSYYLGEANEGFILYGATSEVKLSKGESSYYLINYNSSNESVWETIGESPLDKDKKVRLLPNKEDNLIKEYLLLYSNDVDKSSEVVKIKTDGEIKDKIKKIYDEYYTIEDFIMTDNILYLVGQINCPKDDTCEYDSNSLFLISEEEKVIEVKDNDSRNVLIIMGLFILLIVGTVIYRKKRVIKAKKDVKKKKKKVR